MNEDAPRMFYRSNEIQMDERGEYVRRKSGQVQI